MNLYYTIMRNGKAIRSGYRFFKNELAEETFILKMQQKYMRSDMDCVDVLFR